MIHLFCLAIVVRHGNGNGRKNKGTKDAKRASSKETRAV